MGRLLCCLWSRALFFLLCTVLCSAQSRENVTQVLSVHNASLHAQLQMSANSPAHRDQIAKEGSSTVIECNLNASQNGDVMWFNSKGHSLGEVEGGKRTIKWRSATLQRISALVYFLNLDKMCLSTTEK